MTTKSIEAKAYILHQRAYRNTSLIIRLLVEGRGLVEGVFRGGQSKGLQLFLPYWLYYQSREGLCRLNKLESLERECHLSDKPLLCAFYINELLVKLLQQFESNQDVFALYQRTLKALGRVDELDVVLRRFEINLLQELGYALSFNLDAQIQEAVREENTYRFYPDTGFVCVKHSAGENIAGCYLGRDLLAISSDNYELKTTRLAAKQIMRKMIDYLLNGKTLQSRELFMGVVQ